MAHAWSATTTINRPIDQVFAFLADGTNDTKFSPRVQEITKRTDGPPGVGTVYSSAVTDAGLKTSRGGDGLLERGQGRRPEDQPRVRADRVPAADEDPLEGALEERGQRPGG